MENSQIWLQKYAPQTLKEIAGNEDAKEEMRKWALEIERGKKSQPLLLHGTYGVGKTSAARALAYEMGWDILETNASDLRDGETLKKLYGMASTTNSLFGNRRLILIDEIDSVSDRQEFAQLLQIIKESGQPIALIANDIWDQKLSTVRFICKQIEFRKINSASIRKKLAEIEQKEGILDGEIAESIAKNASGDIRGAINDLQATQNSVYSETVNRRDREGNIFEAVRTVFKTMKYSEAVRAGEGYNTSEYDLFIKWLDENIALEYEDIYEQAQAYHWLSRSDVFKGRIMARQNWGYLKYVNAISTAGVALSKKDTYRKFSKYQFPSSIKMLGQTKKNRELLKSMKKKLAKKIHVSTDEALEFLPNLSRIEGFSKYLELTEDEALFASELYKHEQDKKGKKRKKD
ncbi:replication factor C large subunit [Candidatus Micrarchaeota archaeon]|nr:replication factor C large subunit [Candidatus Micrarchaeota archaeon]